MRSRASASGRTPQTSPEDFERCPLKLLEYRPFITTCRAIAVRAALCCAFISGFACFAAGDDIDDAEDAEADVEEEEEEEEEELERDWVAWRYRKNTYWHDQISHEVFSNTAEGGVGDLVGKYVLVNGIASLAPS